MSINFKQIALLYQTKHEEDAQHTLEDLINELEYWKLNPELKRNQKIECRHFEVQLINIDKRKTLPQKYYEKIYYVQDIETNLLNKFEVKDKSKSLETCPYPSQPLIDIVLFIKNSK